MDTQALRNAYDEFHATAAMSHAAPTDGGWSAELVVAHIALTDELLAATARALLDGRPAAYDNSAASFRPNLQHYLDAIADRDQQLAGCPPAEPGAVHAGRGARRRHRGHRCPRARHRRRHRDGRPAPPLRHRAPRLHATVHLPTHTDDLMALAVPD